MRFDICKVSPPSSLIHRPENQRGQKTTEVSIERNEASKNIHHQLIALVLMFLFTEPGCTAPGEASLAKDEHCRGLCIHPRLCLQISQMNRLSPQK